MPRHLSYDELQAGLPHILDAPKDNGRLEGIVLRPAVDERREPGDAELTAAAGTVGDRWREGKRGNPPDPDAQICIMSARAIALIAQERDNWAAAGDNLFIDMDLRPDNMPPGTRFTIGSALLEVTPKPHLGCYKFADRFGDDAETFVNDEQGRANRLRGIYARVIEDGHIAVGDTVSKVKADADAA